LALEDITIFVPENGQIRLQSIFREQRHNKARVKAMNLADHQIILEEILISGRFKMPERFYRAFEVRVTQLFSQGD
jgi:predicted RNA-binding protein